MYIYIYIDINFTVILLGFDSVLMELEWENGPLMAI